MKSFVVETAKHLHEHCGYDVTLICSPDDAFANSLPEYLHFIPVEMPRGINLSGFSAIRKLRKIFREGKFDLVQYATPNAACYASIAAKREKVPVRLYAQWGIRYVGLSGMARKIFKFLEKLVCKNSTRIHAVSPMNMAFAVGEGLYPAVKACVVGNGGTIGVDMTTYDIALKEQWRDAVREKYGIGKDDFVFGFAGRVSADKGCGELLSSFRAVCEENARARLLIVGPMEENCGVDANLLSWAKGSDRVVLTGKIDNAYMKEYYAAMDVLVHPTYREGFGMVIQEAGALAVPTITTRIPGASEVMEEGVSCLLVSQKSTEDLTDAMHSLLTDGDQYDALSRGAYERTKALYDRPIMLIHQEKAYRRLLLDKSDIRRLILSDKDIRTFEYPLDTEIKLVDYKTLDRFDGDARVVAVAGSRAMAIKCEKMNLPSLRLFQLTSAGFDGVPCDAYARRGVAVANAGTVYSAPIAETVVFGILQMAKRLHPNPNNRHLKLTRGYRTITELTDKRVLIMGAGNIGTAVADRLLGFGVQIDGYDPYCARKTQYTRMLRSRGELIAVLGQYDYIISTLPDNEQTRGFVDAELFAQMKKTAVVVNVGRRAVFDEKAFYVALKKKRIGGAVLDMFEKLPNPITNRFRRCKSVIVLPGVSAISQEVNDRLKLHMVGNIKAVLENVSPKNVINGVK